MPSLTRKMLRAGGSLVVVIPPVVLEMLKWDSETVIHLEVKEDYVTLKRVTDESNK